MLEQWTNHESHHAQSSQNQLQQNSSQNVQSTAGQPQQSSHQNIGSMNFIPTTSPMATQFINAWDDLARYGFSIYRFYFILSKSILKRSFHRSGENKMPKMVFNQRIEINQFFLLYIFVFVVYLERRP